MINIAICISTRNRGDTFYEALYFHHLYRPDGSRIFIVDDASNEPYAPADYRFVERVGIPKVKNKCLELAMDSGAEHIFLFDDDCFPIKDRWHMPYINSGKHHLCFCFTDAYGDVIERPKPIIKGNIAVYTIGNGCMLYFSRQCIEKVGGFREDFGLGTYEHVELSRRIKNAGITDYEFMDVVDSHKLLMSLDQAGAIERTFTPEERLRLLKQNDSLFFATRNDKNFVPYR